MDITHSVTVKISAKDLNEFLIQKLQLPADTKVTHDIIRFLTHGTVTHLSQLFAASH